MKKQNRFMMYIEAQERKMNVEIPESVREEMLTFFEKKKPINVFAGIIMLFILWTVMMA